MNNTEIADENLEDEYEHNYEVNIYLKEPYKYTDCITCYADDKKHAIELAKKHFIKEYSDDTYSYDVEYIGSLESDRSYEMEVDREIYIS